MKAQAGHAQARRARQRVAPVRTSKLVEPEEREAMIAEAAYYRAAARGFEAGHELEDWLAAESEIDLLLEAERSADH
jgi:hypothetical protein